MYSKLILDYKNQNQLLTVGPNMWCWISNVYPNTHSILLFHELLIFRLEWKGDAGHLNINETYYNLIQCHWHTPSEHTLNGTKFDLELHAVHKSSKGEFAVIGILYKIGSPDPFFSKLLNDIKSSVDKDIDVGVINPREIKFKSRPYYRYVGSLTTPPCTEGVVWTIVKKVRTVSSEQLSALKGAVHHGYEENARPTQELGGRQVWLYGPMENEKPT
uniref:Carbonic anhydrase n=1 Tax=Glycine max TaxID=3847 RepID=A0A0R0ELX6_SOYBN